jgi:hypothetical protein
MSEEKVKLERLYRSDYTTGDDRFWTYEYTWEDFNDLLFMNTAKLKPNDGVFEIVDKIQTYFIQHTEKLFEGGMCSECENKCTVEELRERVKDDGKIFAHRGDKFCPKQYDYHVLYHQREREAYYKEHPEQLVDQNEHSVSEEKFKSRLRRRGGYTTGDDHFLTYEYTWEDFDALLFMNTSRLKARDCEFKIVREIQAYFIQHTEKLFEGGMCSECENKCTVEELRERVKDDSKIFAHRGDKFCKWQYDYRGICYRRENEAYIKKHSEYA